MQVPFQEFISSLVVTRDCLPLPSEQFKKHTIWTGFLKYFNSKYTDLQICVEEKDVSLVYLAHSAQDIDLILREINNVISQQKAGIPETPTDNSDTMSQTNLPPSDGSQTSDDSLTAKTKIGSQPKSLTLSHQNQFLVWMLMVLNLEEAVARDARDLTVKIDEDEEEIQILGNANAVNNLKSVLKSEFKKVNYCEH